MTDAAGWTPDAIRAAIRDRGTTIYALSIAHGLQKLQLAKSLTSRRRQQRYNRILADFLRVPMHELWPAWYVPGDNPSMRGAARFVAADFERILARVAAGEKLLEVLREPDQPHHKTLWKYRRANPAYGERLQEALGDGRGGARMTETRLVSAIDAVRAGSSLKAGSSIMSLSTIQRYRRVDETFASSLSGFYVRKVRLTDAERAARAAARRNRLQPFAHREAFVRALRQDEVYAVVEAAVPRGLPPDMRDDVKSDLVVALLNGEVQPAGAVAAARRYMTAWNRTFLHHDRSLDAEREDGLGLAGILADQSFDVGESGIRVRQAVW